MLDKSAQNAIYIPQRFITRLLLHAYMGGHVPSHSALILGIHGPAGYGKSFQVRALARKYGLLYSAVSASSLASTLESEPVEEMEAAYVKLAMQLVERDLPGFLLIDDFDMSIAGIRTNGTYTVNSQLLSVFLMNLCDDPLIGGRLPRSVPIVVTGNNLGVVHPPLIRQGRMDMFEWIPTQNEMIRILRSIFDHQIDDNDIGQLLNEFQGQPVSFFQQLVVEIWRMNASHTLFDTDSLPGYSKFHLNLDLVSRLLSFSLLLETGRRLLANSRLTDHISTDTGARS